MRPTAAARALCALCVVSVIGCKTKPRSVDATACSRAHLQFWTDLTEGKPADHASLVCAELYRHEACPQAWQRELVIGRSSAERDQRPHLANPPDPARIAAACASAYCAELDPKPALCRAPIPGDNARLVESLEELDAAILARELSDSEVAAQLAKKALVCSRTAG